MRKIICMILSCAFTFCLIFSGCKESMENSCKVNSIINFKVYENSCMVSEVAYTKLSYASNDVLKYVGYEGKIDKAIFNEETSQVEVTVNGEVIFISIEKAEYKHNDKIAEATLTTLEKKAVSAKENGVVMMGDSLFANWSEPALDLQSNIPLYNFGVGGLCVSDLRANVLNRLVIPVSPSIIIIHVGVNDIFQGGFGIDVYLNGMKGLIKEIKACLPKTKIYFVSIVRPTDVAPTVTGYTGSIADGRRQEIDRANIEIESYCEETGLMTYVNAEKAYVDSFGRSEVSKFYYDGIHLLPEVYGQWGQIIGKAIFNK